MTVNIFIILHKIHVTLKTGVMMTAEKTVCHYRNTLHFNIYKIKTVNDDNNHLLIIL